MTSQNISHRHPLYDSPESSPEAFRGSSQTYAPPMNSFMLPMNALSEVRLLNAQTGISLANTSGTTLDPNVALSLMARTSPPPLESHSPESSPEPVRSSVVIGNSVGALPMSTKDTGRTDTRRIAQVTSSDSTSSTTLDPSISLSSHRAGTSPLKSAHLSPPPAPSVYGSPRQLEAEEMVREFHRYVHAELTPDNIEAFHTLLKKFDANFLRHKNRNRERSLPIYDANVMLMLDFYKTELLSKSSPASELSPEEIAIVAIIDRLQRQIPFMNGKQKMDLMDNLDRHYDKHPRLRNLCFDMFYRCPDADLFPMREGFLSSEQIYEKVIAQIREDLSSGALKDHELLDYVERDFRLGIPAVRHYHATKTPLAAVSIHDTNILVAHNSDFEGAFTSDNMEFGFGTYILAVSVNHLVGFPLNRMIRRAESEKSSIWLGFMAPLPTIRGKIICADADSLTTLRTHLTEQDRTDILLVPARLEELYLAYVNRIAGKYVPFSSCYSETALKRFVMKEAVSPPQPKAAVASSSTSSTTSDGSIPAVSQGSTVARQNSPGTKYVAAPLPPRLRNRFVNSAKKEAPKVTVATSSTTSDGSIPSVSQGSTVARQNSPGTKYVSEPLPPRLKNRFFNSAKKEAPKAAVTSSTSSTSSTTSVGSIPAVPQGSTVARQNSPGTKYVSEPLPPHLKNRFFNSAKKEAPKAATEAPKKA